MGNEQVIRLACFLSGFLILTIAERLRPRRRPTVPRGRRWFCNLTLILLDTTLLRLALPLMPPVMAELAARHHWGLVNLLHLPLWLSIPLGFIALDLVIYLQHRAFHRFPLFWRLHRMHHTDLDIDISTGTRFHPFEILLSMFIKLGVIVAVGVPAVAALVFEVVLNATSMFSHTNVNIPIAVDRRLRLILVTPDMHRVHHSVFRHETDSNFSFNLSCWDRLLGTYRDQPRDGHDLMTIGLKEFRDHARLGLWYLLALPFRRIPAASTGRNERLSS